MARPDFSRYAQVAKVSVPPSPAVEWEPPTQNQELVRALSEAPEVTFEAPREPAPAPAPRTLPSFRPPAIADTLVAPNPVPAPVVPAAKPITLVPPPPTLAPPPPAEIAAPVQLVVARPAADRLIELESELLGVSDRERLIEIALQIASGFAQRVALFIVQRGSMQGVRCLERGEPRAIEGVLVPLDAASMLTAVAASSEGKRFDPRERALDARVLQLLGDEGATEVSLFPVALKQRVVNVLYASNGPAPLGAVAYAALAALADQMALGYGQLILSRKGAAAS
jgi:hypothetical protein